MYTINPNPFKRCHESIGNPSRSDKSDSSVRNGSVGVRKRTPGSFRYAGTERKTQDLRSHLDFDPIVSFPLEKSLAEAPQRYASALPALLSVMKSLLKISNLEGVRKRTPGSFRYAGIERETQDLRSHLDFDPIVSSLLEKA